MQLAASIFKAYDIRGIVPTTLDEDVARALGRAFGSAARAAGEQVVAVGRDGRLSGPALAAATMRLTTRSPLASLMPRTPVAVRPIERTALSAKRTVLPLLANSRMS